VRLIAYLRVSSEGQEDGLGLDVQRAEIAAWAGRHGHELVREVSETASGTILERDGISEALAAVRDGEAEGIVVYRLDRLARDLLVQEQLLAEAWRHGEVCSASESEQELLHNRDDPDDPSRKMLRRIVGAIHQNDRDRIVLRLRKGRERKAAQGGYAGGRPGYGWRAEGRELVEVREELQVLERMHKLRGRKKSLREIAATLNEERVPAPAGDSWSAVAVQRALQRWSVGDVRRALHAHAEP
jgi:site-specific DNA recombinase